MRTLALALLMPMAAWAAPPRIVLPDWPPPMPAEELKDPAALADRIAKNSKKVSDRLADAKTEQETLRDQKQVKDDLDALIKLLEPPPPPTPPSGGSGKNDPPPPSNPPPAGSGGSKGNPPPPKQNLGESQGNPPPKQEKGGSQGNMPPEQSAAPPMGADPKPASANGGQPGQPKAAASLPALPPEESLARDFWGNLPDAPRQQMMQFYREQYMTKYKDLLSQYYQSLAEKEKKK